MDSLNWSRRNFLRASGFSLAAAAFSPNIFAIQTRRYRVGLIGTGWYGKSDLFRLLQVASVEVVALCDVDANRLADAKARLLQRLPGAQPKLYRYHEEMLMQHPLDLVLIATPDHWHALQAIDVLNAGAHLYLQKPISVDVLEGEAIVRAQQRTQKVIQVGTQRRSTPHLIDAKREIVDKGLLGNVAHVEMFCYYHMRNNSNPPVESVPTFLDYERWCGPAPLRPYDGLPHGGWWRAFMEYGNGIVGDMCIHMLDAVRWMLGLGWSHTIYSEGGIRVQRAGKSNITDTQTAVFEFEGVTCTWTHRTWGEPTDVNYPWGYKLIGDKGTLSCSPFQFDFTSVDGTKIHREAVYEREKYPEDTREDGIEIHAAPATRAHLRDWLSAIETGSTPVSSIQEAHCSTASCILANLSMDLKRPVQYDPVRQAVTNDQEATDRLARSYRAPWKHPALR
jgi:predicted dehydrogenase